MKLFAHKAFYTVTDENSTIEDQTIDFRNINSGI
jgi:hypothetical protein